MSCLTNLYILYDIAHIVYYFHLHHFSVKVRELKAKLKGDSSGHCLLLND